MAFIEKDDYFGLGTTYSSALEIKSSAENKSASVYEAKDEKGDVISREVYGEQSSPANSFEVKGDCTIALVLGTINAFSTHKYCFGSMSFKTSLGNPATVDVSGEQVEAGATTANSSTIDFGYLKISRFHDAQIPELGATAGGSFVKAFELESGASGNYYLNDTQIDLAADISKATVNGTCVNHDIQNGRCTITGTIVQVGSTAPTITPGSGWTITGPLTKDSQDENQPTWKFTLTKSFASAHPTA